MLDYSVLRTGDCIGTVSGKTKMIDQFFTDQSEDNKEACLQNTEIGDDSQK